MPKLSKTSSMFGAGAVLLVASLAFAQTRGILFPDWSPPTKGTYQAPHGEIGKAPNATRPWSQTTYTSAITGQQPLRGQPVSVVGEIVDLSCYLQVGKHGDKHRDCGQKCARNGQPIGIVTSDGTVYTLMDEEHDPRRDGMTELRKELIEHMAHVMKVEGTYTEVGGQKAIYVQGFVKK